MATTRSRPPETSPAKKPNGRGARRRRRNPIVRAITVFFQLVISIILAAIIGAMIGLYIVIIHLPTSVAAIENYKPFGRTMIYSSDGVLLANLFQQNRQTVEIDQVPKNLQNATVAIEDSRFYSNVGIDFRGIGRALWKDVRGNSLAQGGSTITQQLVRNLGIGGVTRKKTITRKLREALLAIQIERNYSKQQILTMYLNQVYYGSGAYGVQAAAQTYFGKSVNKLDLAQCALLAGLPQLPAYYSPYSNMKAAKDRRDTVLGRMRDLGYITPAECTEAQNEPIKLISEKPPKGGSQIYHAPYFVDYVVQQLSSKYGSDFIYRGGIEVDTTLNWQMQADAEQDVRDGIANARWSGADQSALVAMDPSTGYIKAMVGGVDYNKSQFNIAAFGRRQPGSSFKPTFYTAALDSGLITENTRILDEPISFPNATGGWWTPKNDDGRYHGWVTAKEAIAQSINVPAVKVLKMVGIPTAINYARMMGVTSPLAPYYTLALGASAVTPLEMADVYATIDNLGDRPIPLAITRITDMSGSVIEDDEPQLESTGISKSALTQMTDMLHAVATEGTASASFRDDNPPDVCVKTGTTQNHMDVWLDGFTKKLVCIVWAGHPTVDPKTGRPVYGVAMNREAWGATIATPIWKSFMVSALAIEAKDEAKYATHIKAKVTANQAAGAANGAQPPATTAGATTAGNPDAFAKPPAQIPDDSGTTASTTQPANAADGSHSTAAPAASGSQTSASQSTTSVWIDNATGLRAPPNSPDAHQETFVSGTEPTAYAPGYNASSSTTPSSSTSTASTPAANPTPPAPKPTPAPPARPAQTTVPTHRDASATPRVSTPPAAPRVRYVTVTVCAESGLLATKWCPETIERIYVAGQEPHRYCTIHKPPPGER